MLKKVESEKNIYLDTDINFHEWPVGGKLEGDEVGVNVSISGRSHFRDANYAFSDQLWSDVKKEMQDIIGMVDASIQPSRAV